MSRAARFGAVLGTLLVWHNAGDHVLQTEHQAVTKATPGLAGWRAMFGHVASYHAAQVAALVTADRTLGLRPGRVAAAVALSAATHAVLDRRWVTDQVLRLTGHPGTGPGTWRSGSFTPTPGPGATAVPLHGPYLADQAFHHAVLFGAALIATGGDD